MRLSSPASSVIGGAERDADAARHRPLRRAQADRRAHGGAGAGREDRAAHAHGAAWRPLRRRDRALSDRPMVRRRQDAGAAGDRGGARRPHRVRAERNGRRPTSTGWTTSSPGASRASSGGAIRFRPGTAGRSTASGVSMASRPKIFVAETEADALAQRARLLQRGRRRCQQPRREPACRASAPTTPPETVRASGATRTCSTPGSPRRCGRSRRWAGPTRRRSSQRYLSDRRAGHRLRHHLLLGRAHDDDGPAFHAGGAVPHRLHPRAGARRARRQDVEVEGQRHRPARPHRRIRRRRAALHARGDGGAGPRHQAVDAAGRRLSQFRDQALERRALRRDERLRHRRRFRSDAGEGNAQPLDRAARPHKAARGDHRGDRGLPVQRRGQRGLPLRLEHLLRLVSRTGQAGAVRRGRRRPRPRRGR